MRGCERKVQRKRLRSAIVDVKMSLRQSQNDSLHDFILCYLFYDAFSMSDCVVLNVTTRDLMINDNKCGMTWSWPNRSNNSALAWRAGLDQEKPVSIIGVFPRFESGTPSPPNITLDRYHSTILLANEVRSL